MGRRTEDPYIKIQVINEDPLNDEIDQGAFWGNNYYGPVPWGYDWAGVAINIMFVPVEVNNCSPTRDDFERAAEYVKKTYPISNITAWEDEVLRFDGDPTVENGADNLLDDIWWIDFENDVELPDMHYYGLVCPVASIGGTGRILGMGGVTTAFYGNDDNAWGVMDTVFPFGGSIMAHELGHNFIASIFDDHHVLGSGCSIPKSVDHSYPQYQDENGNNLPQGSIGEYGFTLRLVYCSDSFFDTQAGCLNECSGTTTTPCSSNWDCPSGETCVPTGETWFPTCSVTTTTPCSSDWDCPSGETCVFNGYMGLKVYQPDRYYDFMSYCPYDEQWISPYTYVNLIYALDYMTIIGYTSLEDNTLPKTAGEDGDQEYLIAGGKIHNDNTVELNPFFIKKLPVGTADEVGTGPYSIELLDGNGDTLFTRNFELDFSHAVNNKGVFNQVLPYHPSTARIKIKEGTIVLEIVTVSENIPEVTVTYPNGGEFLSGEQTITWSATDADGDILYFNILYSSDGGNKWSSIATRIKGTSYVWDTGRTAGSNSALIRIIATDGVNTVQDDSDSTFIVDKKSPEPVIISPENNTSFFANKMIPFRGNAYRC